MTISDPEVKVTKPAGSDTKKAAVAPPKNSTTESMNLSGDAKRVNADADSEHVSDARRTGLVRRDPFRPFTLNLRSSERRTENRAPLERYEIGQLKLVGVIWNVTKPIALVEDIAGLGYAVKVGTLIGANDGRVKKIIPDEVLVEEEYFDLYGTKRKREVSMKLAAERAE